jgi:hypothetical protein
LRVVPSAAGAEAMAEGKVTVMKVSTKKTAKSGKDDNWSVITVVPGASIVH